MTLWTTLTRAATASGDDIHLRQRGETFEIRYNGIELMSSFNHQSEDQLALRAMRRMNFAARRILIGGLGLGYTARAVLDLALPEAEVHVCELIPEIAAWNRDVFGHLAGHPLGDPRCHLHVEDVQAHMARQAEQYDLILLDTDNGPDFIIRPENTPIYEQGGIALVEAALAPGGLACFWSATASEAFEARLSQRGAPWTRDDIALVPGRVDAMHHLYSLQKQGVALKTAA
ncbi:spermidine synthase [Falsigemmobacter faecalis]|uniref:Spermidine synthase n=1 Tax=Falsigemmobacter faecalis TaxID=2488730 RepID=A0A3P3DCY5_9RHOB|nr:hypothetical protein [Falsigemmobacter faecalis]RRH72187.1 hypothetical protein EG244_15295 [Falsigemmobacter faecalis]